MTEKQLLQLAQDLGKEQSLIALLQLARQHKIRYAAQVYNATQYYNIIVKLIQYESNGNDEYKSGIIDVLKSEEIIDP